MLQPLRNGTLLKLCSSEPSSIAGLIITSAVNDEATVVAIGPDVKELKPGDRVKFDTKSAVKVDDLLLCREADVLCVIADR